MMMNHKLEKLFLLAGIAAVCAALSLFLWNQREAAQAGQAAEAVLPQMIQQIETPSNSGEAQLSSAAARDTVEVNGYEYIGYLSIPSLELELPVMEEWDYPRLKIAPCRYAGSVQTDDLVISAHNYPQHFGRLSQLSAGDPVDFVSTDGITTHYQVTEVTVLAPTAVQEMTSGEYSLTLFTCTVGGKARVTVRCTLWGDTDE